MIKKLIYAIILLIALSFFLVDKSGMWESRRVVEVRTGVEYSATKHTLHWDRLGAYIRNLPKTVKDALEDMFNRWIR